MKAHLQILGNRLQLSHQMNLGDINLFSLYLADLIGFRQEII